MYTHIETNWHDTPLARAAAPRAKFHRTHGRAKPILAALMFIAAYFTTVTVNAQPADGIQLNSNKVAVVTGTVKSADENFVIVDSAGKDIKIILDDVHLQGEADTIFTPGMTVTADGKITGDDFGMALFKANSITATEAPAPAVQ